MCVTKATGNNEETVLGCIIACVYSTSFLSDCEVCTCVCGCRDLMCRAAKKCRLCVWERRSPDDHPPVTPPDLSDPLEDIYCSTVCSRILYDIMASVFLFLFVTGLNLTTIFCLNPVSPGSQYDTGAYVASVASSLVHNMTLELT